MNDVFQLCLFEEPELPGTYEVRLERLDSFIDPYVHETMYYDGQSWDNPYEGFRVIAWR